MGCALRKNIKKTHNPDNNENFPKEVVLNQSIPIRRTYYRVVVSPTEDEYFIQEHLETRKSENLSTQQFIQTKYSCNKLFSFLN